MNVDIEDVTLWKEMYAESCVKHNEALEELVRLIKPDYSPSSNEREALKLYSKIVQFLKMDDLIWPLWFSLAAFYQLSPLVLSNNK